MCANHRKIYFRYSNTLTSLKKFFYENRKIFDDFVTTFQGGCFVLKHPPPTF